MEIFLLEGLKQEAEENVGGKQDKGEDDGAHQATPGTHGLGFLFLLGFFIACVFFLGRRTLAGDVATIARESCVAIGSGCLFHSGLVGRGCGGFVLGWCVRAEINIPVLARSRLAWVIVTGPYPGFRNWLMGLQQALRADNHAVIGDELLVADFQLFAAFWAGPAHSFYSLLLAISC